MTMLKDILLEEKCEFDIEGECHAAVCYTDKKCIAKSFNEDGSINNINYISNEQLKKEMAERVRGEY